MPDLPSKMSTQISTTADQKKRTNEESQDAPKRKIRKLGEPNYVQFGTSNPLFARRPSLPKPFKFTTSKPDSTMTTDQDQFMHADNCPREHVHTWKATILCLCQLEAAKSGK